MTFGSNYQTDITNQLDVMYIILSVILVRNYANNRKLKKIAEHNLKKRKLCIFRSTRTNEIYAYLWLLTWSFLLFSYIWTIIMVSLKRNRTGKLCFSLCAYIVDVDVYACMIFTLSRSVFDGLHVQYDVHSLIYE